MTETHNWRVYCPRCMARTVVRHNSYNVVCQVVGKSHSREGAKKGGEEERNKRRRGRRPPSRVTKGHNIEKKRKKVTWPPPPSPPLVAAAAAAAATVGRKTGNRPLLPAFPKYYSVRTPLWRKPFSLPHPSPCPPGLPLRTKERREGVAHPLRCALPGREGGSFLACLTLQQVGRRGTGQGLGEQNWLVEYIKYVCMNDINMLKWCPLPNVRPPTAVSAVFQFLSFNLYLGAASSPLVAAEEEESGERGGDGGENVGQTGKREGGAPSYGTVCFSKIAGSLST